MIDVENDEDGIEYYIKCGYSEDEAKFLYEYYKDYKPHCTIGKHFVNLTPTLSERLSEKIGRFLNKIIRKGEQKYE